MWRWRKMCGRDELSHILEGCCCLCCLPSSCAILKLQAGQRAPRQGLLRSTMSPLLCNNRPAVLPTSMQETLRNEACCPGASLCVGDVKKTCPQHCRRRDAYCLDKMWRWFCLSCADPACGVHGLQGGCHAAPVGTAPGPA